MVKLNCMARKCVNNEGGLCGAEYILIVGNEAEVTRETYCTNFRENNIINQIEALGNTNYVGEIAQMISDDAEIKMSPMVSCHAKKCFFNIDGRCEAADISITGSGARNKEDTCCETFIE